MVTRCPECSTAFRVATEQLQARDGAVRCGRCQRVFNAFDSLTTWPDSALAEPEASDERASDDADAPADERQDFVEPAEAALADEPAPGEAAEEALPAVTRSPGDDPGAAQAAAREDDMPQLDWALEEPPRRRRANLVWGIAVALAALVLAGQAAYFFRTELAAASPPLRPHLEAACRVLGCEVPLPGRAEYITIEASDLKVDETRASRLLLTAALRNRAPFPQRYPALELTLTGPQNQPLARRVFLPEDYAAKDRPLAAGLAPNAVADILLPLDTGDLAPTGYRLYSFYP
ncbi:MAG TPA: DUF3426 domain-containing protein [Pelomicrobium sp.]|nr:DUF3426 domain-containing protein [Pelomicrobium sp.]